MLAKVAKLLFYLTLYTGRYQVEPISVTSDSGPDPTYNELTIYAPNDNILEEEVCLCLELAPVQNSNVFFNDNYQAQLCFEDDEGELCT